MKIRNCFLILLSVVAVHVISGQDISIHKNLFAEDIHVENVYLDSKENIRDIDDGVFIELFNCTGDELFLEFFDSKIENLQQEYDIDGLGFILPQTVMKGDAITVNCLYSIIFDIFEYKIGQDGYFETIHVAFITEIKKCSEFSSSFFSEKDILSDFSIGTVGLADNPDYISIRNYNLNRGIVDAIDSIQSTYSIEAYIPICDWELHYNDTLLSYPDGDNSILFLQNIHNSFSLEKHARLNRRNFFVFFDRVFRFSDSCPNLIGACFDLNEAAFLSGALSGLLTNEYSHLSSKLNDGNVIGILYDNRYISTRDSIIAGIRHVNPDCSVLLQTETKRVLCTSWGKDAAYNLLSDGADIIFILHDAVITDTGAFKVVQNNNTYVITFNTGLFQEDRNPDPDTILTSIECRIDEAVQYLFTSALSGHLDGNTNILLGLSEGSVRLAQYRSYREIVSADIQDTLDGISDDIISGSIQVPDFGNESFIKMHTSSD